MTKTRTANTKPKYKHQWKVPSSSGSGTYTVSLTLDGKYVCHCWPFLRNRLEPCKHIQAVQAGDYEVVSNKPEPAITYAVCRHVTRKPDGSLLVPTIPFGASHTAFVYTVFFDLLVNGVSWRSIKEQYRVLPEGFTLFEVLRGMTQMGYRTVLDPDSWIDERGWTKYTQVAFTDEERAFLEQR